MSKDSKSRLERELKRRKLHVDLSLTNGGAATVDSENTGMVLTVTSGSDSGFQCQ